MVAIIFSSHLHLLLISATLSEVLRLEECSKFDGEFSEEMYAKVLAHSLLLRFQGRSLSDCIFQCISHKECKSINYLIDNGDCELNSKDSRDSNAIFEERKGWTFLQTPQRQGRNLGPYCQRFSPCQHGYCRDICEEPGYKCTCEGFYIGSRCEVLPDGSELRLVSSSCLNIRNQNRWQDMQSGFYWIKVAPGRTVQMYCDMEVDGGGWTQVGNMNNTSGQLTYSSNLVYDDVETLGNVRNPYYALSTTGLAKLRNLTGFQSIRIYCHKPSLNRIIHISTARDHLGYAVLDYVTGVVNTKPASCGSYMMLTDDTSYLSRSCDKWASATWGFHTTYTRDLLYDAIAFVPGEHHITTGNLESRFECDDSGPQDKRGVWMFFVRSLDVNYCTAVLSHSSAKLYSWYLYSNSSSDLFNFTSVS